MCLNAGPPLRPNSEVTAVHKGNPVRMRFFYDISNCNRVPGLPVTGGKFNRAPTESLREYHLKARVPVELAS